MLKSSFMKTLNAKRIFIVDDDPYWLALLTQLLTALGYDNIHPFSNGNECLKNLHLNPAIVFLDYQMEEMDGLKVLQKVKEYYPGINVVFCTANEDLEVAIDAMKFGSFDYLLKSNASQKSVNEVITAMANNQLWAEKVY